MPPYRLQLARCAMVASLLSCGAKTGLRLPDAATDAPDDVFTRFDRCVVGRFELVRRSAEILFVIDRSGSMSEALSARDSSSRWQAMRSVFQRTLPLFDRDVAMGVIFYPRVPLDTRAGSLQYCELSSGTGVDLSPREANSEPIIRAIFADNPRGATPTAAAIRRATSFLQSHQTRGRARYLLLATDGAPNCNPSLDLATCTCLGPPGSCDARASTEFCLDDEGSVSAISAARNAGVTVYVVGIDGDLEPRFRAVLDRMAVAGGRALPGSSPRYYSIGDSAQLLSAFTGIQRTVVQCSFVTPSRPDDPDAIEVSVAGSPIARDPLHRDGWDWTDRDYGELTLYGSPCETVISRRPPLQATVRCATE